MSDSIAIPVKYLLSGKGLESSISSIFNPEFSRFVLRERGHYFRKETALTKKLVATSTPCTLSSNRLGNKIDKADEVKDLE